MNRPSAARWRWPESPAVRWSHREGLAGAVGIVIAQAAGRDVYSGGKLLRFYGRLTVLGGLAAIVGPVIGGQLAAVTDWRGVFLSLAAVGVAILGASLVVFRETLPAGRRVTGGFSETLATSAGSSLTGRSLARCWSPASPTPRSSPT